MLRSSVILCPGQGAQAVGMGKAWFEASPAARAVFAEADAVIGTRLGPKLSEVCWNGPPDALNRTDVSQPAIFTASVACFRALLERWNVVTIEDANVMCISGLSLGEYTALHLAGAFSFRDGLELVTLRGRAMQDAADAVKNPDGTPGSGMVAIIGGDDAQAEQVCQAAKDGPSGPEVLVCANFNAPGQVVLSGHKAACERAVKAAEALGLRATLLQVAGAFHSPIMAPAADKLAAALAKVAIAEPRATVVSNVTARPHGVGNTGLPLSPSGNGGGAASGGAGGGNTIADSIRRRLVEQLTSPVRWAESCRWIASGLWGSGTAIAGQAGGGADFHELAPGTTLKGLMRRIDKSVKVSAHDLPTD
jgi:[acyl-carrier-protein] S-malonyltransferase